jgi:WD40 repeat protein
VWEVATGKQRQVLSHRRTLGPVQGYDYFRFDVAWSPDGRRLATSLDSAENWSSPLQIWDAATGRRVRELGGRPEGAPEAPAWSPNRQRLAAVWDGITVWDPATGKTVRTLANDPWPGASNDWPPDTLAWSPHGTYLAARNFNDYYGSATDNVAPIRIWSVATGKPVYLLRQPGAYLEGPAWSPDGTRLACAASDGTLRLWEVSFLATGSLPRRARARGTSAQEYHPHGNLPNASHHAAIGASS